MSLLSIAELQAQVETDLGIQALQLIIDSVERDIDIYAGPMSGYTVELDDMELVNVLRLPVQAESITSLTEYTDFESNPTKTVLAINDYELSNDQWHIRRLSDGTNSRITWGWHIIVLFDPVDDTSRRKQAAILLSQLEIESSAYDQEEIGDWKVQQKKVDEARAHILQRFDQSYIT